MSGPHVLDSPTQVFNGLDAVAMDQLGQPVRRHRHTFMHLLEGTGLLAGQRAFEIVEHGQQIANEGFLFGRGLLFGIAPGAFSEIIEVRGEAEIVVFLRSQRRLEQGKIRPRISD